MVLLLVSTAKASEIDQAIADAAKLYQLDPGLLKAIAIVESNLDPYAVGDHGNSFGMFQINRFWLDKFDIPPEAMFDVRRSAHWAAYVLNDCMQRYSDHFWRAVGCYNAKSESKRIVYANKVYQQWIAINGGAHSVHSLSQKKP